MPETCATELKFTSPIAAKSSYMAFLPAVLIAAGIAFLSLWENPQMPPMMQASDKVMHSIAYALLSISLMAAWIKTHAPIRSYHSPVVILLAVTVYGGLIEVLQRFCTLTRTAEMADLIADFVGAFIGILIVILLYYIIPTSHRK